MSVESNADISKPSLTERIVRGAAFIGSCLLDFAEGVKGPESERHLFEVPALEPLPRVPGQTQGEIDASVRFIDEP
jgi:hypothetical protein